MSFVLVTGTAAPALAQQPSLCPSGFLAGTGSNVTTSATCARLPDVFVDSSRTERVDRFETRLIGLIDGRVDPVYDMSWALPFDDPVVQAGVAAARLALEAASADPLDLLGPIRVERNETLFGTVIGAPVPIGEPDEAIGVGVELTIGPATARSGDLGRCTGVTSGGIPTGCSGGAPVALTILAGNQHVTNHFAFTYTFERETLTTVTFDVSESWRLVGAPRTPIAVTVPTTPALLAIGLLAAGAVARRRRAASRQATTPPPPDAASHPPVPGPSHAAGLGRLVVDRPRLERIDRWRTQVVGLPDGSEPPVYDVTWALPFDDPAVQAGLDAARLAIDATSAAPLDIFGPSLTERTMTLRASMTADPVVGDPRVDERVVVQATIGPRTIRTGNENFLTHPLFTFTFDRAIVTTETFETFERRALVGVPRGHAGVPAPGEPLLLAFGALSARPRARGRRPVGAAVV